VAQHTFLRLAFERKHGEHGLDHCTRTGTDRELALGMKALKRIGRRDDVADIIAFLAFRRRIIDTNQTLKQLAIKSGQIGR
jgi:hypothetical protein